VIGRCAKSRKWLLWTHAWCQPEVLDLRKDIASKLRDLEAAGDLTICEHPTQDVEEFADIVERLKDAGLLPEKEAIGLDPAGVAAIIDALVDRGITDEQLMGVPQGYRLNGAVLGMERKVKDGTLLHGGQALNTWCVGNAKTERRGNAVLITKQVSGVAKIDPLIAAFNAFSLMTRNPEGAATSVYDLMAAAAA
jgi:phage terminase large subunit-like protein